MKLPLGKYFGIPLSLHISYIILLCLLTTFDLCLLRTYLLITVLIIFHEFGHALTAKLYGYKDIRISLNLFGGIAEINRWDTTKSKQEFLITLAGPLINLIFILFLLPFVSFKELLKGFSEQNLVSVIFKINLLILLFNMLPVFPLDGGRLLRSGIKLLSKTNHENATLIAVRISQFISSFMLVISLFYLELLLVVIFAVLIFAAQAELEVVMVKEE